MGPLPPPPWAQYTIKVYLVNPFTGRFSTRVPPLSFRQALIPLHRPDSGPPRARARPRMGTGGTRPAPGGPWASSAQQTAVDMPALAGTCRTPSAATMSGGAVIEPLLT